MPPVQKTRAQAKVVEAEQSVTEDEDMDNPEDLEDLDEEQEEEQDDLSDSEQSQSAQAVENRRKAKEKRKKEILIANRALRIKMGKSGAQAASRRSIKKGKDACQRKLWNIDVSKLHFNHFNSIWLYPIQFKSRLIFKFFEFIHNIQNIGG